MSKREYDKMESELKSLEMLDQYCVLEENKRLKGEIIGLRYELEESYKRAEERDSKYFRLKDEYDNTVRMTVPTLESELESSKKEIRRLKRRSLVDIIFKRK